MSRCTPHLIFLLPSRPPRYHIFPYTTLFRSNAAANQEHQPTEQEEDPAAVRSVDEADRPGDRQQTHRHGQDAGHQEDRKSTRLNSSHVKISYAVFCLKTKNIDKKQHMS